MKQVTETLQRPSTFAARPSVARPGLLGRLLRAEGEEGSQNPSPAPLGYGAVPRRLQFPMSSVVACMPESARDAILLGFDKSGDFVCECIP